MHFTDSCDFVLSVVFLFIGDTVFGIGSLIASRGIKPRPAIAYFFMLAALAMAISCVGLTNRQGAAAKKAGRPARPRRIAPGEEPPNGEDVSEPGTEEATAPEDNPDDPAPEGNADDPAPDGIPDDPAEGEENQGDSFGVFCC